MRYFFLSIVLIFAASGCQSAKPQAAAHRNVVVWLSIDGFRGDYVDRNITPEISQLMREGEYSRDLQTIVPSLTFPSHVAEATGTPASVNGIPSNNFYDITIPATQPFKSPGDPNLLLAEPIWLTAKRQGIRTLVFDWPMSYVRTGPNVPDYDLEKFDLKLTDDQRVARLLDVWQDDTNATPLQLVMGYIKETDHVGQLHGPDSVEINRAIREVDANVKTLVDQSIQIFKKKMRVGDQLYILITTDHGMMQVKYLVNLKKLFASPLPSPVRFTTSGPLGLIYLDQVASAERNAVMQQMLGELQQYDFLDVYTQATLPKSWRLNLPTRVGDIILMLKPGYTFDARHAEKIYAVGPTDETQGMHGYPPEVCEQMRGFCLLWRYPAALGGKDLGMVHAEQFHPTVAKVLGIAPAENAKAAWIALKN